MFTFNATNICVLYVRLHKAYVCLVARKPRHIGALQQFAISLISFVLICAGNSCTQFKTVKARHIHTKCEIDCDRYRQS